MTIGVFLRSRKVGSNVTSILDTAKGLVSGARKKRYGHPLDNFEATAKLFTGVLLHKLKADITVEEALLMMQAVKIARESRSLQDDPFFKDNRVDGAGYWQALQDCIDERKRRERKKKK